MRRENLHKCILLCGLILALASISFGVKAQEQEQSLRIHFQVGRDVVDPDRADNRRSLEKLSGLLKMVNNDSLLVITKIQVDSYASPEGSVSYNNKLTEDRSASMVEYIITNEGVDESLIEKNAHGIAWGMLRDKVANSSMEDREAILSILDNVPEETWAKVNPSDRWNTLIDSRQKHLRDLSGGRPYNYILQNFFPDLRSSNIVTVYFKKEAPSLVETTVQETPVVVEAAVVEEPIVVEEVQTESAKKLILAIKTNLLYDLALVPNLEVEVPIGKRWSVNGEFGRGWWLKENTRCWQIQNAGIEGRYWFGNREKREQLSGWFGGVFSSYGFCDIQLEDAVGLQSDFYFVAGLSAGYSLRLSTRFNMEFSAGVGYILNEYQRYWVEDNETLIEDGQRVKVQSLMPAKLKVSLAWLIFGKTKGDK